MSYEIQAKDLIGETLAFVDASDECIMLTTVNNRKIIIHHSQDCCETVKVEDTQGNWHDLIGKVIIGASEEVLGKIDDESGYGTYTKTTLTFKTSDATVISRWHGESNGYYSESVTIEDITQR